MRCAQCSQKAVISQPPRCETHFIESFEQQARDAIKRFDLIRPAEKICVAASGGKDSLALLEILHREHDVEALCVDEGIPGYRDQSIADLRAYCTENDIPLRVVSFKDLGSKPLHKINPEHPCSTCGVLRRKALLEYSKGYDLIATGHNLDDEAQTILMNLLRNQKHLLARMGPRTEPRDGIAARIKPFYLIPEREIRAYCLLKNITTNFAECPNVVKSFRWQVGERLNELEREQPGSKKNIVETFLRTDYHGRETPTRTCERCGDPSSHELCRACEIIERTAPQTP